MKDEMRTFHEQKVTTEERLRGNERDLGTLKEQERNTANKISEYQGKEAILVHKRVQEQDLYAEKAKNIRKLCQGLNITVDFDLENCNDRLDEVVDRIKAAMAGEEEKLSDLSLSNDCMDVEQQVEIDKLRVERTAVETDLGSKKKQLMALKEDKGKHDTKIKASEKDENLLKVSENEIERINQCLKSLTESYNLEDVKKQIAERKVTRDRFQTELDDMDGQVEYLSTVSSVMADITAKEKQLELRESEMRRLKNKHSANLRKLFNNQVGESNFKQRLDAIHQAIQMELNSVQMDIKSNQHLVSELQINHKNKKSELKRLEAEVSKIEDRVDDQCQSIPYADVLERTKANVAKYQFEHGTFKSSELLYKK